MRVHFLRIYKHLIILIYISKFLTNFFFLFLKELAPIKQQNLRQPFWWTQIMHIHTYIWRKETSPKRENKNKNIHERSYNQFDTQWPLRALYSIIPLYRIRLLRGMASSIFFIDATPPALAAFAVCFSRYSLLLEDGSTTVSANLTFFFAW